MFFSFSSSCSGIEIFVLGRVDSGAGWGMSEEWIWLDSLLFGFIFSEDGLVKIQDVVEEDVNVMR